MPRNWRKYRFAELERQFAREEAELALTDEATPEQLAAALDRLRQLGHRVEQRQLEPDDWALIRALVLESM